MFIITALTCIFSLLRISANAFPNPSTIAPSSSEKQVIIVGGGPTGLASALILANPPLNYNVDVYESSTDGGTSYDMSKSFLYNINPRGQEFTSLFPNIQNKLEHRGVGKLRGIVIVPADPKKPLPSPRSMNVNSSPSQKISYWIPRHDFVSLLREAVDEHDKSRIFERETQTIHNRKGRITIHDGILFTGLCFLQRSKEDATQILVTLKEDATGNILNQTVSLVIGADGVNSMVRQCLLEQRFDMMHVDRYNPSKFKVRQWSTPATGLRLKALQLPANFTIPQEDGSVLQSTGDTVYAIRSKYNGPRSYLSLGMLPNNRNDGYRPANCITRDNHQIWSLKDGESLRVWFEQAFPRMPFKKNDILVAPHEWDRLAKASGVRFPPCQFSSGLSVTSSDGKCGVALVGDAVHAFPPDIGQGVNAGLGDAVALRQALLRVTSSITAEDSLGKALKEYEKNRSPEIKALIRLARFGSPYQYRQPDIMSRIGRLLWTWNVLIRLILNKVTFGLFPSQSILLAQDDSLSFRQVMKKADSGTAALTLILCLCMFKVTQKFLRL